MKKALFILMVTCFVVVGCKNETKKEDKKSTEKTAISSENIQEASFKISGMTCEVGCAKTIASKLSKKQGVVDAKVVFADSIATVKFDKTKTNKKELMAFVEGVGSGDMYKTCEVNCTKSKEECSKKTAKCGADCKCEGCEGKAKCGADCKKDCCKDNTKTACATDCKKECCTKKA